MKKKSARHHKKTKFKRSLRVTNKLFFWQKGSATLFLLLGVVVIGAFFLVGGFPKSDLSNDNPQEGTLISEPDSSTYDSLQLKTLKFKQCLSTITIDLLLDRSGSMAYSTASGVKKIIRLQEAVISLTKLMNDNSILGVQTFSGLSTFRIGQNSITEDIPISYFKDVKAIVPSKINVLTPNGSTPTHDALSFSYQKLKEALPKFPGRKFNFIFVTDGAPCPGFGCSTKEPSQDPRRFTPNPADEIKKLGVNVFSLAIYGIDNTTGRLEEHNTQLKELLVSIASKPENYFEASTGDEVERLLKVITEKICTGITTTPVP